MRSTSTACSAGVSWTSSTFFSLSAMDQLSRLCRNADLLSVALLEADAGRLAGLRVGNRDVRDVQRCFLALDSALRIELRRLAMAGVDVHARHDDLHFLRHRTD